MTKTPKPIDDGGPALCAYCNRRRVNAKRGKAFMLAESISADWEPICKVCYTKRLGNPFMRFKPLAERNKERADATDEA